MKKTIFAILIGAVFSLSANAADSAQIAKSVTAQVSADKSKVLEVVSREVAKSPESAGEIVKAAILASGAGAELVGAIVEAAGTAAPDQINVISQSAIAVAPDALKAVEAAIARLTEVFGGTNPLNFPGKGPVGPTPGGPGGLPLIPQLLFGVIAPPPVTEVNPRLIPDTQGGNVLIKVPHHPFVKNPGDVITFSAGR